MTPGEAHAVSFKLFVTMQHCMENPDVDYEGKMQEVIDLVGLTEHVGIIKTDNTVSLTAKSGDGASVLEELNHRFNFPKCSDGMCSFEEGNGECRWCGTEKS